MITSAELQAKGILTLDLTLQYNYKGEASISESKEIFEKTYRTWYPIGPPTSPLWVYQENTLILTAEFKGNATTAVNAEAKGEISSEVNATIYYNGNEWALSHNESLTPELTISAEANGTATAEVRLIPSISTRFYTVATAALSIEPYIDGRIEATAIGEYDLLENEFIGAYGLTKLDVFMGLDANIMADLTVFNYNVARYPESGTKNIFNKKKQLFGLPKIGAIAEKRPDGKYDLIATSTPFKSKFGLTNSFDQDSAKWLMSPGTKTATGMSVIGESDLNKTYFTGHSTLLGKIGKQFIEVPIEKRHWKGELKINLTEVLPSTSYPLLGPARGMCNWFLAKLGTNNNPGFSFIEGHQEKNIRFDYDYTPINGGFCNSSQAAISSHGGFTARAYIDNHSWFGGDATGQQDIMITFTEKFNDGETRSGTFEGETTFDYEQFRPSYGSMSIRCTGTWEVTLKDHEFTSCKY